MFKVNFNSIQSCQNRLSWDLIEKLKATFHFGIKDNKKIQWVTLFHVEVTIRLLSYACNTCTMRHRLFQSHRHTWTDSYLRLLPWKSYLECIFFSSRQTYKSGHSFQVQTDARQWCCKLPTKLLPWPRHQRPRNKAKMHNILAFYLELFSLKWHYQY